MEEIKQNQIKILSKLLELIENYEIIYLTPKDLLDFLGYEFVIVSKRDLAIQLNKLNLKTKVLFIDNVYSRYYIIEKNKVILTRKQFLDKII